MRYTGRQKEPCHFHLIIFVQEWYTNAKTTLIYLHLINKFLNFFPVQRYQKFIQYFVLKITSKYYLYYVQINCSFSGDVRDAKSRGP
jgi:hypothetical protein